jgi:hypothetical protein
MKHVVKSTSGSGLDLVKLRVRVAKRVPNSVVVNRALMTPNKNPAIGGVLLDDQTTGKRAVSAL